MMSRDLSSDATDIQAAAAGEATRVDREALFPEAALAAARDRGVLGLLIGTEHGGLGGTPQDAMRLVGGVSQACASAGMVLCMHFAASAVIAAHGDDGTRHAVARGERLLTLAFSESGSRSHFWAPLSTARAQGADFVLDADKSFVTGARRADAYVWSSRPVASQDMSTLWLVPRDAPGLSVPGPFDGLGLRGNDSAPVRARNVVVPASARLGADGAGFDIMMGVVLPLFQLMNAAASLGIARAAHEGALSHVATAGFGTDGSRLRDLPTIRASLARAQIALDAGAALLADAADAAANGRPDAMLRVLQSKASASQVALDVTATAMRVCGGVAFRKDLPVERAFRDAQAASVMGPTTDVLHDFVGKAITGLPLFG